MITTIKLLAFIELLQLAAFAVFVCSLKKSQRRIFGTLDLILLLSIPVIGLFGQTKLVFYGYVFVLPLVSVGRPDRLARRYLMLLPMFPALAESLHVGGIFLGTFSAIDMYNLGALIALAATFYGRARPVAAADAAAWLFFFLSFAVSARGVELNGTLRLIVAALLATIPPYFVLARLIRAPAQAIGAMLFFSLGAFSNAIVALFEVKRRWPLYQGFYDKLHVSFGGLSATLSVRAGMLRAQGPIGNPTSLGLVLALGLVVVLAQRQRFQRPARWVVVAVLAGGMIATQSRGAWIAAALGAGLCFLYQRRGAMVLLVASVLGAALALFRLVGPGGRVGELLGRSGHAELTAEYRSSLLARGLQEVSAHPLTGQTRAQLEVSMNDLRNSEHIIDFVNTHLFAALTMGVGGFLLWMIAWIIPLWLGWSVRRTRAAHSLDAPVGVPFGMVVGCFACLAFTSTIDRMLPLVMVSFGLMAAFVRLARTTHPVNHLDSLSEAKQTTRASSQLRALPEAAFASPRPIT